MIFQHGLGGSVQQAYDLFRDAKGLRLISMDCRNHGKTDGEKKAPLTTDNLAVDLSYFIEQSLTEPFFIGGLSLGALLAVKVALTCPQQIRGIVLLRPAWPDAKCSTDFEAVRQAYPAYHDILSADGAVALSEIGTLPYRALVLGMPGDSLHPADFALEVARSFPRGIYEQVPNKGEGEGVAYKASVREHVLQFLETK